jgi:hypothetical protein
MCRETHLTSSLKPYIIVVQFNQIWILTENYKAAVTSNYDVFNGHRAGGPRGIRIFEKCQWDTLGSETAAKRDKLQRTISVTGK